ncbi:MAG: permease-like cell division protein FtsX [Balneolaceae bacterium]
MSVRYVFKEGVAGLKRTRLASFTSIFSLFVAVILIGVLARVGYNGYEVAQMLKQQVEVEIFLHDLDRQSETEIRNRLESRPLVESVHYISKDSASQIFQEEFGLGGEALASLNFLPASFRVTFSPDAPIDSIGQIADEAGDWNGVDEVKFNMALLQLIESRIQTTALAGAALGLLILFASIVLVFNTIRLTIYAKRDLIRAMKLVGATNGFIRRPFLMEGVLQGLIAGVMAAGLLYALFTWGVPSQIPQLGVLEWPFGRWYYLIGGMVLLSMVMGWWGSRWAARKFIRDTTVYGS